VAIGLPTSTRFVDAFFGTVLAGAVPAPLPPAPRAGREHDYEARVTHMLRAIGARLMLADTATVDEWVSKTRQCEASVDGDALGLIQFSSGSTSLPKAVALSHRSLITQMAMLDVVFGKDRIPTDKFVTWLPLYHDMGLIGCLLTSMYMQIPVVIMAPDVFIVRPYLWLHAISRHGGTLTGGPNFAYELCMRRIPEPELEQLDLHTLRQVFNGSEPVSASLMEAFSRRFARCGLRQRGVLCPVYGLAEAALAVTYPTRERNPVRWLGVDSTVLARECRVVEGTHRLTSVGLPMPGVDIEIRDDAGRDLPERRIGRIFVKSPSAMQGYFADPHATAKVLVDDWLDTGDLGFVDRGELYITGRAKDLVIIRGANYAPEAFENCLGTLDVLRPGWVVATGFVPDDGVSEELLILAERNESSVISDSVAMTTIRQTVLAATGVRAHTVVMLPKGTLRRTSSGKIRRRDALERFLAGDLNGPHP
jgi:fatty-acyl-CoA synthase